MSADSTSAYILSWHVYVCEMFVDNGLRENANIKRMFRDHRASWTKTLRSLNEFEITWYCDILRCTFNTITLEFLDVLSSSYVYHLVQLEICNEQSTQV